MHQRRGSSAVAAIHFITYQESYAGVFESGVMVVYRHLGRRTNSVM